MKKVALLGVAFLFAFVAFTSQSFADCQSAMSAAAKKAAKDKRCQGDAKKAFKAFGKQFRICQQFRDIKRVCLKTKRSCAKTAREIKRTCAGPCKKRCRWGRKGRACRRAKRACKRKCNLAKRAAKRICKQSKRACVRAAKQTAAFNVCRNARRFTRKALGNSLKCFGRYFIRPALVCVAELFSKSGQ